MVTWSHTTKDEARLLDAQEVSGLSRYPVDRATSSTLSENGLDPLALYDGDVSRLHPGQVVHAALAHWNLFLDTRVVYYRKAFLALAQCLLEHEARIGDASGGWPISSAHPTIPTRGPWLSARVQGPAISVLLRAYHITSDEAYMQAAHRAVRTCERDILDGGVSTPMGKEGIFFEEVAVYPASHMLPGHIFALLGLYEYTESTADARIAKLMQRGHTTLHELLDEYDAGYWARSDLIARRLATPSQLAFQVMLLEALARSTSCVHCLAVALRWRTYVERRGSRLHYRVARGRMACAAMLGRFARAAFLRRGSSSCIAQEAVRVCVPITAFPVMGGMRTALASLAQVTGDMWQMEYLTHTVGPDPAHLVIHRFGTRKMGPWQFPAVWLYVLAGSRKILVLLRQGADYQLLLPQDGVFTAAFTALVGKLVGIRVVCMDYGNMTLVRDAHFRAERTHAQVATGWSATFLRRWRFACYWPSLYGLAWIAARCVDHFLIAGMAGDGVEDVYCEQLGVRPYRITRYPYMIDIEKHSLLDAASRAEVRTKLGIAANAVVITMICRLSPEKGIDIALESVSQALAALPVEDRERVQVIIAGDGPLRAQVEADIGARDLAGVCLLWGAASRADVISLLSISDLFLHTSTRGAYYTMSILEAMASGCAVVASTQPALNAQLLAEGRGLVVPAGDAIQTGKALVQIIRDPGLRCQMGKVAREYIAVAHSATNLRRVLLRATGWSELRTFLDKDEDLQG